MVSLMSCSYLSAPRCGLIDKMIEIEPKVLKYYKCKFFSLLFILFFSVFLISFNKK